MVSLVIYIRVGNDTQEREGRAVTEVLEKG